MKMALTVFLLFALSREVAQSLVECVEPCVAKTLLGYPGQGGPEITANIPTSTHLPELSGSLGLIGSRAENRSILVHYKLPDSPVNTEMALRSYSGNSLLNSEF